MTAQGPRRSRRGVGILGLALVLGVAGCGDGGSIDPGDLLYGQLGQIEIRLEVPLKLGDGQLLQELYWDSRGAWMREERISYRGILGDASILTSTGDLSGSALAYDGLIRQLHEKESLRVFDLGTDTVPECGSVSSRITFTVRDDVREESLSWVRCVEGSLDNLTPEGARPGPGAARLAQAALLARGATVGDRSSPYRGSVPFGTLDRGSESASRLTAPAVYIDAAGFHGFWTGHAPGTAPPAVDFGKDMVVVGLVGSREEAGDSVEVRRILQVDRGTVIEVVEQVPGEFCSPASRRNFPYHVVVSPRTPVPHLFADITKVSVSCGG